MKRYFTLLLLLLTLNLTSWADKEIKRPDTYNYNRGVEAYDNDNYDEALEYLYKEIAQNPKNGYAYMYVADIKYLKDEYGAALTASNNAIRLFPKKDAEFLSTCYRIRAKIKCALQDTTAALADCAMQIKCYPQEVKSYELRAQILYEQKRFELSNADYKKMIALEPGNSLGYLGIGRNLNAQQRWQEAIEQFTKATTLENDNSIPYSFRAEAYLALGEWDKATDDIVSALYINGNDKAFQLMLRLKDPAMALLIAKLKIRMTKEPNDSNWPYYLGLEYEISHEYAKAITYYEKSQKIEADAPNLRRISQCYYYLGNFQCAYNYINQAVEMDSTKTNYRATRAEMLYELGKPQEAIKAYDELIAYDPEQANYYHRRAFIKSIIGDYEGAIDDETLCLAISADGSAYPYVVRGESYMALGNIDKARNDFKKAIAQEPTPDTYENSQYAYLGLGYIDKAIEVNDTILKRNNDAASYYDAACLYARMQQRDKAMQYLKKAFEMGFVRFAHIEHDHDMDYLRNSAEFKSLINTYRQKVEQNNAAIQSTLSTSSNNTGHEVVTEVPFTKENGVCNIKCNINNLPLYFVFDTGAATVSLSMVEATFMMKNGYLSKTDVVGSQYFQDANGNVNEGTIINLRHVDFGGLKLENVRASVVRNQRAPLLLGQSVLGRLGRIEIDNLHQVVKITSQQ